MVESKVMNSLAWQKSSCRWSFLEIRILELFFLLSNGKNVCLQSPLNPSENPYFPT